MLLSEKEKRAFLHKLCILSYRYEKSSILQIQRFFARGKNFLSKLSKEEIVELIDSCDLFQLSDGTVYYDAGDPEEKTTFYLNNAANARISSLDPGEVEVPDLPIHVTGGKGASVFMMVPGFVYHHQKEFVLTTLIDGSDVVHILFNSASSDVIPAGLAIAHLRFVINSFGSLVCVVEKLNPLGHPLIVCHQREATVPSCDSWSSATADELDCSFKELLSALCLQRNKSVHEDVHNLSLESVDGDDLNPLLADMNIGSSIITIQD